MNPQNKKNIFLKIKSYALRHKIISILALLIVVAAAYGIYKTISGQSTSTKYVLASVSKGSIVSSVSGTGQVAAVNQVSITSAVSGDVDSVLVKAGDEVKKGDVVAGIDSTDAVKAVNTATLAVENSRMAYQKAIKSANTQSATSSSSDLNEAYQDGYNALASTFIHLPSIFSGVSDIYYTSSHSPYFSDSQISTRVDTTALSYKSQAGAIFDSAKKDYDARFSDYKNLTSDSDPQVIVSLLKDTNLILKKLLSALTGTYATINYIGTKISGTVPSEIASDKSAVNSFVNTVNSDISTITNTLTTIEDAKDSAATAELNMKSSELSLTQSQDSLQNAEDALADHSIKAPFDGIIAKVNVKVADKVSNGTAVATIITKEKMVNISLNELDAAKVKAGDKAELTFDAIDELTLDGHVSNVDIVGTVSQGVVSYTIEIQFDTNDDRVKPGMTVSAAIVTENTQNVLIVPSSAVKTKNNTSYVQVLDKAYSVREGTLGVESSTLPAEKVVKVGISDDTHVEILSGLSEGDQVVVKTVVSSASNSSTPSLLSGILGGNRNNSTKSTTSSTSSAKTTTTSSVAEPPSGGGQPPAF